MTAAAAVLDEPFEVTLDAIGLPDIVRYAGASGDFHAVHYDEALALEAGHPTSFAHGMFTAGLLGVVVGERFGPERVRVLGVRFVAPLYRGQVPRVLGHVVSVQESRARLELTVVAGDRTVVQGWAEIDIQDSQSRGQQ